MREFDSLGLALSQKGHHIPVDECHFFQVKHDHLSDSVQQFSDVPEICRSNPTAQLKNDSLVFGTLNDS